MLAKVTAVTIADAVDTVIATLDVTDFTEGVFTLKNSHATRAFDTFKIKTRTHADAPQITAASAAADFSTPNDPVLFCSGAPVTLAAVTSCNIRLNLVGIAELVFTAQGASGTATAELYACCN